MKSSIIFFPKSRLASAAGESAYAPAVAMRNDDIVIEARVQAYDCEGEICIVKLLQDGSVVVVPE